MNATDYQREAARVLIDAPDHPFTPAELQTILLSLNLSVAAGQVAEYIKKAICHRHGYDHARLIELLTVCRLAVEHLADLRATDLPILSGNEQMILWCALGLAGEAGEVVDTARQVATTAIDCAQLGKEIGDCEWYAAALCTLTDQSLGSVMQSNIDKLKRRYPNGYSSADSQARVDQQPELPLPTAGALDVCGMCGEGIWFVDPYWDHQGENKPRHPGTPTRYAL